jgi:PD-(D/E)XK nuclease superfamily
LRRLVAYLDTIPTASYPHQVFRNEETATLRSSQVELSTLPVRVTAKENLANDLAALGLMLAKTNRQRHESIEEVALSTDSTTIACEVPVYLTPDEWGRLRTQGFHLTFPDTGTPITGHIDILQVRNGLIRILDYKPDAQKIRPVSQLVIYGLALAVRTGLLLKSFSCAWFNEIASYEFFPLHAVYPKRR